DFTELALFLAFAVFGLKSLRNGVWFSMIAYPILARYAPVHDFRRLLPSLADHSSLSPAAQPADDLRQDPPAHYRLNALFAVVAILLLVMQSPWVRPAVYKTPLIDRQTPVEAVNFIESHKLMGNIFHPQTFGDYLIWRLWPQQKSFIDGRVHLFGLDFVKDYQLLLYACRWEDVLSRWNIKYLLLHNTSDDEEASKLIESARTSG